MCSQSKYVQIILRVPWFRGSGDSMLYPKQSGDAMAFISEIQLIRGTCANSRASVKCNLAPKQQRQKRTSAKKVSPSIKYSEKRLQALTLQEIPGRPADFAVDHGGSLLTKWSPGDPTAIFFVAGHGDLPDIFILSSWHLWKNVSINLCQFFLCLKNIEDSSMIPQRFQVMFRT